MRRKNNQKLIISLFVLLLLSIGIVYAYLTSNLSITGSTRIANNTWDIHFANLVVNPDSVEATTPADIDQNDTTSISYAVKLNAPGDFYEFTVDIVNAGTLPGKVSVLTIDGISTYSNIVDYSITYTSGTLVQVDNLLNPTSSKNIKVRVFYKDDIDADDLLDDPINLDLTLNLTYNQTKELETNAGNLLQNLSSSNSCITKYNGQVTDRVGVTETATNVYFDKCADKRNIIFGGFCWQAIRTTETGGIKMIYNGEPVNGKCESTRGNHKGIVQSDNSNQNLSSNYLYGSSFTYDTTTNEFTLVDTETATWNDSTYENLLGKFTCKSTDDTCSTIYQINSYSSNTSAYLSYYTIDNTNYAQIGSSSFNANKYSPAMVGYMFNKVYNRYTNFLSYVENVYGNTYSYGDSYTDNGNGTYTINNATHVTTWPTNSSEYNAIKNKYICKNPTNDTCNEVWYTLSIQSTYFSYFKSSVRYMFASSYTYANGTYTLNNDSVSFWNVRDSTNITSLNTHHYTCWNTTGTCATISYVHKYNNINSNLDYIKLSGGKNISDALNEMLFSNDINKYNSSIKGIIDSWYSQNLSTKTNMLEDTVYCNARNVTSLGGWVANGGEVTSNIQFKNYSLTTDLECPNAIDQFSGSNNIAKLTYPIGLLTDEERYNINTSSLMATGTYWWGLSPLKYAGDSAVFRVMNNDFYEVVALSSYGVRPVVSLSSGTVISSGMGSEDDPWIVE